MWAGSVPLNRFAGSKLRKHKQRASAERRRRRENRTAAAYISLSAVIPVRKAGNCPVKAFCPTFLPHASNRHGEHGSGQWCPRIIGALGYDPYHMYVVCHGCRIITAPLDFDPGYAAYAIVTGDGAAHIEEIERILERLLGSWPVNLCPLRSLHGHISRMSIFWGESRN